MTNISLAYDQVEDKSKIENIAEIRQNQRLNFLPDFRVRDLLALNAVPVSDGAKILYITLHSHVNFPKGEHSWQIALETLSKETKFSRSKLKRCINELIGAGLIDADISRDTRRGSTYRVYPTDKPRGGKKTDTRPNNGAESGKKRGTRSRFEPCENNAVHGSEMDQDTDQKRTVTRVNSEPQDFKPFKPTMNNNHLCVDSPVESGCQDGSGHTQRIQSLYISEKAKGYAIACLGKYTNPDEFLEVLERANKDYSHEATEAALLDHKAYSGKNPLTAITAALARFAKVHPITMEDKRFGHLINYKTLDGRTEEEKQQEAEELEAQARNRREALETSFRDVVEQIRKHVDARSQEDVKKMVSRKHSAENVRTITDFGFLCGKTHPLYLEYQTLLTTAGFKGGNLWQAPAWEV